MTAKKVSWVKQEDSHGCGIACLAMVTGKTYTEIRSWFKRPDFSKEGVTFYEVDHYLTEHGYAVARKWQVTQNEERNKRRDIWPALPFADVHICSVRNEHSQHFVVMLADGMVLDPLFNTPRTLADYVEVCNVAAIHRITERKRCAEIARKIELEYEQNSMESSAFATNRIALAIERERVMEAFKNYWDKQLDFFKWNKPSLLDKPQLLNMLNDQAFDAWKIATLHAAEILPNYCDTNPCSAHDCVACLVAAIRKEAGE